MKTESSAVLNLPVTFHFCKFDFWRNFIAHFILLGSTLKKVLLQKYPAMFNLKKTNLFKKVETQRAERLTDNHNIRKI